MLHPPTCLVGDEVVVRHADGTERARLSVDVAASTTALPAGSERVEAFVPWCPSVRGVGQKSRRSIARHEDPRQAAPGIAARTEDDVAVFCRSVTEEIRLAGSGRGRLLAGEGGPVVTRAKVGR